METGNVKKTGLKRVCLTALFLLLSVVVRAYDFSVTVASGQTLYFSIVGGGVEVTYPNAAAYPVNGWDNYTRPVGMLQIPNTVIDNGIAYEVVSVGQLAFYGCTGLTSVMMGDGIVALGNSAFNGCSSLSTVVVPSTVDTIGVQTFAGCSSLEHVWCNKSLPPRTSPYSFNNTSLASSTLHVLPESVSAYNTVAPWSSFGTVVGDGPMVTLTVSANDPQRGSVSGSGSVLAGTAVTISALPYEGFSFICWNDGDMQSTRTINVMGDMNLIAMFFPLVHDTLPVTLCGLQVLTSQESLGLGVGSTNVPMGTVVEICALPFDGSHFTGWSDGSTANPRQVTVSGDETFVAFFEQLSIGAPEARNWKVRSEGKDLVVEGVSGLVVSVYDMSGRCVSTGVSPLRMTLPTVGLYAVKVGDGIAVKVSVE